MARRYAPAMTQPATVQPGPEVSAGPGSRRVGAPQAAPPAGNH